MTREQVREAFQKLDIEDRLTLADEFWRGLHGDPEESPLTLEQHAELERRLDEYERNPEATVPWEEVRAKIEARLR